MFLHRAINVSLTLYLYTFLHRFVDSLPQRKYLKETTSHVYSLLNQAHSTSQSRSIAVGGAAARVIAFGSTSAAHSHPSDGRRRLAAYYLRHRVPEL